MAWSIAQDTDGTVWRVFDDGHSERFAGTTEQALAHLGFALEELDRLTAENARMRAVLKHCRGRFGGEWMLANRVAMWPVETPWDRKTVTTAIDECLGEKGGA